MPYIDKDKRDDYKILEAVLNECPIRNSGELNYILTKVCLRYLSYSSERYQTYNDIMGALSGCSMELYRRKIAAYEDQKKKLNGEVYGG